MLMINTQEFQRLNLLDIIYYIVHYGAYVYLPDDRWVVC